MKRKKKTSRRSSRPTRIASAPARRLVFEGLEARRLLAATDLALITGTVFKDLTGDGFTPNEQVIGAAVQLYRDVNGNGALDAGDGAAQASATTDSAGQYRFERVSAGNYFVKQPAQTVNAVSLIEQVSSIIQISQSAAEGVLGTPIDSFVTQQTVMAPFPVGTQANSSQLAGEALGGERDLIGVMTAGTDIDSVTVSSGSGRLAFDPTFGARGTYTIVWDGRDGNGAVLDHDGLGGIDLTNGGTSTHLQMSIGVDKPNGTATLRIYTNQNNWSQVQLNLADTTGQPDRGYVIDLENDLQVVAGTGANIASVGAVELEIVANVSAMDGQMTVIDSRGPTTFTSDFPNLTLADLSLSKSVDIATPSVGQNVTFTVTLSNAGPASATNVVVSDLLPAELTLVSATPTQGSYSPASGQWAVGTVLNNNTASLQIVATINSAASITNVAEVLSVDQDDPDSVPGNNVPGEDDRASVVVTPEQADLSLTKSASNSTPNVSENVTFTITVTNAGPSTATGVTVSDSLPVGLSFVSANATRGSYSNITGIWTIGNVGVGESVTMQLVTRVGEAGNISNTAQIATADQYDPDSTPGNNVTTEDDQSTVTIVPQTADLSLIKTVDKASPNIGENVTFKITLTNAGPNTATGVAVTDRLPDGMAYVSSTATLGSYNPVTGVWTVNSLPSGGNTTLNLTGRIVTVGSKINTAEVTAAQQFDPDSTPNNNVPNEDDQSSVTVTPQSADLALTKTVNNAKPNVGDNVTFTVTLSNFGPSAATGVTVRDSLQNGLSYVSARPSRGTFDSITRIWNVGQLAAGATATLQITARVDSAGTTINTAEVASSDQVDPDSTPNNNNAAEDDQDSASVSPQQADLSLTKTVDKAAPTVGEEVVFTVTVANAGPDTATGVSVRDQVPEGMSFVRASATQGSYNRNSGLWTVGTLPTSASASLQITARATQEGVKTNAAEVVAADQFDPDSIPNNNVITEDDQAVASVNPETADLSLTKVVDVINPNVGDDVTFIITLNNAGPNQTAGVTVRDLLPAGLEYLSSTASVGSYDFTTGIWTVGDMVAGSNAQLELTANVVQSGNQVNTAEVISSSLFDPDSTPDNKAPGEDDQASITITPQRADLSLTKQVDNDKPNVGQTVNFTLTVSNAGPDAATGVAVRDGLPTGLGFVSANPSQGTYNNATGIWTVGVLDSKSQATLTVTAIVLTSDPKTNTAEVSAADQFDPDSTPDNNQAKEDDQAALTVTPQIADLSLTKTVDDPTPNVGQNVTFTLTLSNAGPSAATNVQVRDILPDGLQFVSSSGSTGAYDPESGIWTVDRVAGGSKATMKIVTTALQSIPKINPAEVIASDQFDPDSTPGNNNPAEDDQASISVTPQIADLSLTKTVNSTRPNVGDKVTFTLTVANEGPDAATNVFVSDKLPAGFKFNSALPSQGVYNVTTGQWRVGTIASDGNASLQVIATVTTLGEKVNVVEIFSVDQFDPDSIPDNGNTQEDDYATVAVLPLEIDLAVQKVVNNPTPNLGDNVTFTVGIANTGPDTASGVVLTDKLPAGLSFVDSTTSQGSYDSGTGIWNVGSLAPNVGASLEIVARVDRITQITNTAEVTAATQQDSDSTPGNKKPEEDDQASVTIKTQLADLFVTKTASNTKPNLDEHITFTITVNNTGPDAATGLSLEDALPDGLVYVSSTASLGTYEPTNGLWTVGVLDSGTSATLELVARTATPEPKSNTAQVFTVDQADPDSTPNNGVEKEDDQQTIQIVPQIADLTLTTDVSPDPVLSGDPLTYTMTVRNNGPATATDVVLTDSLPVGVTFRSVEATQGTGTEENGIVTVQIGSLAARKTVTVTLIVDVNPEFKGDLRNVVTVTSDQFDTTAEDNSDTLTSTAKLPPATISGTVYFDVDDDGRIDPLEIPIGGVKLVLEGTDVEGNPIREQFITEGDGRYIFDDLPPGTYTVTEVQPEWFTSGKATAGDRDLGHVVNNDQFFFQLGSKDVADNFNFGEIFPYYTRRRVLASTPKLYP